MQNQRITTNHLSTGINDKEEQIEKLIKKLNQEKFKTLLDVNIPPNQTITELHIQLHKIDQKLAHKMRNIKRRMNNELIQQRIKKIEERIDNNENTIFNLIANDGKREKLSKIITKDKTGEMKLIHKPDTIKEQVAKFYRNLFKQKRNTEIDIAEFLEHQPSVSSDQINLDNITITEIANELKAHATNTSPGENNVTYDMLKAATSATFHTTVILNQLFNAVIELNHIPSSWKGSNTILLQKMQGNFEIENWRPIALLNVEYKLFTGILNKRIKSELLKNNLLPDEQNGFTNNRDTAHCIFPLLQTIQDRLANNTELHVAYIDICKAFDSTNHKAILTILEHMGFKKFIPIIKELFRNIYTRIETEYGYTGKVKISRGVRQGDAISPTLFIIFLSPVMWTIKNLNVTTTNNNLMTNIEGFADDIALVNSSNESLQKSFDLLSKYCDKLDISINAKKSAYAWLNSKTEDPKIKYKNKNKKITEELTPLGHNKCYKYLGLYISLKLDWTQQMQNSETALNNCTNLILSKRYLYTHHHIKLINIVVQASLGYRMQFVMFPKTWLDQLNKAITTKLSKSIRLPKNSDQEFWWLYRNLRELNTLNTARYITTYINRIANSNNHQVAEIARKSTSRITFQLTKKRALDQTSLPDEHLSNALTNLNLQLVHKEDTLEVLRNAANELQDNPIASNIIQHSIKMLDIETNSPTKTPHLTLNSTTSTIIAIDGSYKKTNPSQSATAGMIIKQDNIKKYLSFPTIGPHTSFEGEAQALEAALLTTRNVDEITIITDNKALKKAYRTMDKWTHNKWMKSSSRSTLRRIHKLQQEKKTKDYKTILHHVYSHLLDEIKPQDYERKLVKIQNKFPNNWEELLTLNQEVDNLAKNTLPSVKRESIHTKGLDSTLLMDNNLSHITDSPNKYTKKLMTEEIRRKWTQRCQLRSERANREDINWQESIWPIGYNINQHKQLQNFQHKLKQRLIPTRQHMSDRIKYWSIRNKWPNNINKYQKKKLQIKYADPHCLHCRQTTNTNIISNTNHVFTECSIAKEHNANLQKDILNIINKKRRFKIRKERVAWWFTTETTPLDFGEEEEKKMGKFDKIDGDQGYIPKHLRKYLDKLSGDKISDEMYNKIIKLIQLNTMKKWAEQNQLMDKHANEKIKANMQNNQSSLDNMFH